MVTSYLRPEGCAIVQRCFHVCRIARYQMKINLLPTLSFDRTKPRLHSPAHHFSAWPLYLPALFPMLIESALLLPVLLLFADRGSVYMFAQIPWLHATKFLAEMSLNGFHQYEINNR